MNAVCQGNFVVYDFLLADDVVDGCGWTYGALDVIGRDVDIWYCDQPPTELLGRDCISLVGSLTLIFTQPYGADVEAPRLGAYLDLLRLNNLNQIEGDLNIVNAGTLMSPKLPFSDVVFLPRLRRVSTLRLNDKNPSMGFPPLFSRLSGLVTVEQANYLEISSQGFVDLNSFWGLKCVNLGVFVQNNKVLASFDGLQNVKSVGESRSVNESVLPMVIKDNLVLANLSALSRPAGCGSNGVGGHQRGELDIALRTCPKIATWSSLCMYVQDGRCS